MGVEHLWDEWEIHRKCYSENLKKETTWKTEA
jgi:hypothetical protein